MNAVQVHEARRESERFIVGLCLDKGITADYLFGLDEWTIDHTQLSAAQTNSLSFCRGLQPSRVDHGAVFHRLAHELAHRIEEGLWHILHSVIFSVFNEHHESHRVAS